MFNIILRYYQKLGIDPVEEAKFFKIRKLAISFLALIVIGLIITITLKANLRFVALLIVILIGIIGYLIIHQMLLSMYLRLILLSDASDIKPYASENQDFNPTEWKGKDWSESFLNIGVQDLTDSLSKIGVLGILQCKTRAPSYFYKYILQFILFRELAKIIEKQKFVIDNI